MKWDGIDMPEMFGGTILDMIQQGYPFEPMLNFLDNMSQNPSDHAITELFEFMENKNMPITPDGHFLAYKAVDLQTTEICTLTRLTIALGVHARFHVVK